LLAYDPQETTRRFFPELLHRIEAQPGVRPALIRWWPCAMNEPIHIE
jgi:hypothetical protein